MFVFYFFADVKYTDRHAMVRRDAFSSKDIVQSPVNPHRSFHPVIPHRHSRGIHGAKLANHRLRAVATVSSAGKRKWRKEAMAFVYVHGWNGSSGPSVEDWDECNISINYTDTFVVWLNVINNYRRSCMCTQHQYI